MQLVEVHRTLHGVEIISVPVMGAGIAGVKSNCLAKLLFGFREIPILIESNVAQGCMGKQRGWDRV